MIDVDPFTPIGMIFRQTGIPGVELEMIAHQQRDAAIYEVLLAVGRRGVLISRKVELPLVDIQARGRLWTWNTLNDVRKRMLVYLPGSEAYVWQEDLPFDEPERTF